MELTITTLSGPVEESEYRFREFPVTIGRRLDNHIAVSDPAVSRYHCQIVRVGDTIRVVDLGSQNGIRVNHRQVQQEMLADGDVLSVGGADLRVLTSPPDEPPTGQLDEPTRADGELSGMDTVSVDPADSVYLQSTPLRGAGRSERDLWILLGLCRTVAERATPEEAQNQLIERLFEAIPAERGAILLCDRPGSPPASALMRSRIRGADSFEISRTVVRQVLQEGLAFLRTRIQDEQDAPRTMVADRVQSALAAPLMVAGRVIGVLYLDTRRSDALFDRAHLDLAAAAAATVAATIESLRRLDLLLARTRLIEEQVRDDTELPLLGESREIGLLRANAKTRALDDDPILICGPAGSEGGRLARWIHDQSTRKDGPFVQIQCDAADPATIERELFGDEQEQPGVRQLTLLETAYGGTLLLLCADALPLECRPKLVQIIRTGLVRRRAGIEEIPVDLRVILLWEGDYAIDLIEEQLGTDLARLAGRPLEIPRLDDRPSDVPALAERIAEAAARRGGRQPVTVAPGTTALLKRCPWPDNLTQLRGVIERAEASRSTPTIEIENLPEEILESGQAAVGGYHERVFEHRRRIILDALERTNGNFSEAAGLLGINRTYLHRLINTLDLRESVDERFDRDG